MFRYLIAMLAIALTSTSVSAGQDTAPPSSVRTRVIVLGVDHAAQLVAKGDQPGALAAFVKALSPDAICIERPPEQAARGDHYEFTYEIQGVILPIATETGIDLCPIDWIPPTADQQLAFGLDLETPPEVRPQSGFRGFLSFPDPATLKRDLFDGDRAEATAPTRRWAETPAARADRDYPRRLYLYRTFMQARLVRTAAAQRPGRTVLVVVGQFHKPDIEAILREDPAISLVQPSTLHRPTADEITHATTQAHRAAILRFNLLGAQAATGNVDWPWVREVLAAFEAGSPGPEARLYRARYLELTHGAKLATLIDAYRALARDPAAAIRPIWTGVKDTTRIDSYFDPFGNLDVAQRAGVELARCLAKASRAREATAQLSSVRATLSERMARQLDAYAARFNDPAPASPAR